MNENYETVFFMKAVSSACISLLCYSTMSKLQPSVVMDTGNNILLK